MAEPVSENSLPWTERPQPATGEREGLVPNLRLGLAPEIAFTDSGTEVRLHLDAYLTEPNLHWAPEVIGHIVVPFFLLPRIEGNIGKGRQSVSAGVMLHTPLPDVISVYVGEMLRVTHDEDGNWTASGDFRVGMQAMILPDPLLLGFVEYSPPIPYLSSDEHDLWIGVRTRF